MKEKQYKNYSHLDYNSILGGMLDNLYYYEDVFDYNETEVGSIIGKFINELQKKIKK